MDKKIISQFYQIFKLLLSLSKINYVIIYYKIIIFNVLNTNSEYQNVHFILKNDIKMCKNWDDYIGKLFVWYKK